VSVRDSTIRRLFCIWIYTTRVWRWLNRVETCSPAFTLYITYFWHLLLLCLTDLHPIILYKHFGMEHLKFKSNTLTYICGYPLWLHCVTWKIFIDTCCSEYFPLPFSRLCLYQKKHRFSANSWLVLLVNHLLILLHYKDIMVSTVSPWYC